MSYSEVFGGAVVYPAGQTYLSLTFSTDQVLQWPIEQAVAGDNVAASIIDLTPTVNGLNVDFSDARQVSKGIQTVFNNVSGGGETVTIRDADGGTILSIVDGTAWVAYLVDNTTNAGTWRTFQLGAGMTVAVAGALAGAGIKAITTTLNQTIAPTSTAVTPITWVDADRAQMTIWTGGVGILDLPAVTVGSDWFSMIRNGGSGSLTVTPPSGTIDDGATLILDPGQSATIVTDGTNFFTVGLGQATAGFFDFLELNVAGSGDFTLSGVQLNRISYRFIGVLTGNRKIIVPGTVQQYWVDNSTTGAFTFEVATAAQVTPVQIVQNQKHILYSDGVDVVNAEDAAFASPLPISSGGTGATSAAMAISNLGAADENIDIIAGDGMVGGGNLTGPNRTLDFNLDSIAIAVPDTAADFFVFQDTDMADVNRKALLSTIANVSQLVDSAANVRVTAETGGFAQIRSDTNSDVVPRGLTFAHLDGVTGTGFLGWNSFSEEMDLANNINAVDADLRISTTHASSIISIIAGGFYGIQVGSFGVNIRGSAANNALLRLTDFSFNARGAIGYFTSDVLTYTNLAQQSHLWEGEDSITATVTMLELNPNFGCKLFFKGDGEVAHCALLADGGFEVNNTLTGGGFERVLTEGGDYGVSRINVQNGNYTFLATDQGKTISKRSGGAGETYTIPSNASVGYPQGTMIGMNNDGGGALTIDIDGGDTLVLSADGSTGSRTLADQGFCVIEKVNTTRWKIAGQQLT